MNKTDKKQSTSLWSGKFKEKELKLYEDLTDKDINIILEYQKKLPILQDNNKDLICLRDLHEQLKSKKHYSEWFPNMCENLELLEGIGFFPLKRETTKKGGRPTLDHSISIETGKEIAMITGIGNRVNEETKELSRLARKYFITCEKALKSRYDWNKDRQGTIDSFFDLNKIIFADLYSDNRLGEYVPDWWNFCIRGKKNTYAYEMYLLDEIIIGMSSREYKAIHGLPKSAKIRDTFSETQLEDFEVLQRKSAEYLVTQDMYSTIKRMSMLKVFYGYYKDTNMIKENVV